MADIIKTKRRSDMRYNNDTITEEDDNEDDIIYWWQK